MASGFPGRLFRGLSRPRAVWTAMLPAALACSHPTFTQAQPAEVLRSRHHTFRLVAVAKGLQHPWGIAFLPNGDLLVTERPGRLRVVRRGVLEGAPLEGIPPVRVLGQGGLLDVALHPQFASNRLVYLCYSKPGADGSQSTTAVIRGTLEGSRLANIQEIFEARAWGGRGLHFGCRMAFDAKGYLFLTVGDRGVYPNPAALESHPAQGLDNHQGKVLRLQDDGRVPPDNPFVGRAGALPEIWSYGHRNPQGLVVHPETGEVWLNEHGPQGGDELNRALPGRNYGWPVVGYGVQYGGAVIHASTSRPGMEEPIHYWVPSVATSGLLYYTGEAFPRWRGSFFNGGLAGEVLARVVVRDGKVVETEDLLRNRVGRIRDVRQGPDGFVYLLIDDPDGDPFSIVRLEPSGN